MRFVKAFSLSIITLAAVAIFAAVVFVAVHLIRMKSLPAPAPFERVIIYTETGTRLFEMEEWRSAGRPDLPGLLSDTVIDILKKRGYEIEMAVDRFDEKAARAVQKLNRAGVKVWVWPLHGIEQGYWLSTDNAARFPALYDAFRRWIDSHRLKVHGVMLDMEPSYADGQKMAKAAKEGGVLGGLKHLMGRRDPALTERAVTAYAGMVKRMKGDGFEVSTFSVPYVLDDRRDGDATLQEMFHVAWVPSDVSSYMLYRSYFKDSGLGKGTANVLAYAVSLGGQSAGIGDYMNTYITFEDFENDLRLAARCSPVVHIYNLEGLVSRGWLDSIAGVDLSRPVDAAVSEMLPIAVQRCFFFIIDLCYGASRLYLFGAMAFLWAGLFFLFVRRRRNA